jgi:hypothetical protein
MIGSKHVAEAVDSFARTSGRRALYVRYKPDGNDGSRGVQVIMPEWVTIKQVRILLAESLRFPGEGKSAQG